MLFKLSEREDIKCNRRFQKKTSEVYRSRRWSYRKICVNILSWHSILILGEGDVCCLLYEYKTFLDIMLLTLKCIVYFMFLSDVFFVHYKKRSFMLKGGWRSQILIFFQDIQQSNFYIPIE